MTPAMALKKTAYAANAVVNFDDDDNKSQGQIASDIRAQI